MAQRDELTASVPQAARLAAACAASLHARPNSTTSSQSRRRPPPPPRLSAHPPPLRDPSVFLGVPGLCVFLFRSFVSSRLRVCAAWRHRL